MRRVGLQIIGLLAVVAVASLALGMVGQSRLNRQVANPGEIAAEIAASRPETILLGNSMLGEGIDAELFEALSGGRTLKLAIEGSATAVWYLMIKNVFAHLDAPPRRVIILFRDEYLTEPEFRASGANYKARIDALRRGPEPVLDALAYPDAGAWHVEFMDARWPLFKYRAKVKTRVEGQAKALPARLLTGKGSKQVEDAIAATFADANLDPRQATAAQLQAETITREDRYDFSARLEKSFLPHMIQEMQQAGIELVLVRVKRRSALEQTGGAGELQDYIDDLNAYLNRHGVAMIDFMDDERIGPEHFGIGDHLNQAAGRPLFTRLLAGELARRGLLGAERFSELSRNALDSSSPPE